MCAAHYSAVECGGNDYCHGGVHCRRANNFACIMAQNGDVGDPSRGGRSKVDGRALGWDPAMGSWIGLPLVMTQERGRLAGQATAAL